MDIITKEQVDKVLREILSRKVRHYIQYQQIGNILREDGLQGLARLTAKALNKEIYLSENKILAQTFPIGKGLVFNLKDVSTGWDKEQKIIIESLFKGQPVDTDIKCTINMLSHHTELGVPTGEYYDIRFDNGLILNGVNGYHLTEVEWIK